MVFYFMSPFILVIHFFYWVLQLINIRSNIICWLLRSVSRQDAKVSRGDRNGRTAQRLGRHCERCSFAYAARKITSRQEVWLIELYIILCLSRWLTLQ
jgi:hypothetical protein